MENPKNEKIFPKYFGDLARNMLLHFHSTLATSWIYFFRVKDKHVSILFSCPTITPCPLIADNCFAYLITGIRSHQRNRERTKNKQGNRNKRTVCNPQYSLSNRRRSRRLCEMLGFNFTLQEVTLCKRVRAGHVVCIEQ